MSDRQPPPRPRRELRVEPLVTPRVTLQVTEHGDRDAPVHLVLLHGFPDDQTLWDPVAAALPDDWHVVTYDGRGSGRSSRPTARSSYRSALLVEDLLAVLDETVPAGEPVHLVGHDWGSVIGWDAVAGGTWDPRLERIASYTSISGPPLDHLATLTSTWPGRLGMLPQLVHSIYALVFTLPVLPELGARYGQGLLRRVFGAIDPTAHLLPWGREVSDNSIPAINVYRANAGRLRRALPWRTSTPILVVVALRDGFVLPRSLRHLDARCRDLTTVEIDCGHWVPRARPEELAGLVTNFVRAHV